MRLLLDTHAFLWFILDDPQLSAQATGLIVEPDNEILISPASYWEIAIKISLNKYSLPEPYEIFMERELATNDFRVLPIEPKHTAALTTLPFHHRDPFDRLLVAQAMVERSLSPVMICYWMPIRLAGYGNSTTGGSATVRMTGPR